MQCQIVDKVGIWTEHFYNSNTVSNPTYDPHANVQLNPCKSGSNFGLKLEDFVFNGVDFCSNTVCDNTKDCVSFYIEII